MQIITNGVIPIKIAILSDVHGNLPAFEAVLNHIHNNNVDLIYNLGDLIGKGPCPREVIELSMKHCDLSLLGNWEDFLLYSNIDENPIRYYRNMLDERHIEYLKTLPYGIEFYMSGRLFRIFHAHPFNIYTRVFRFSDLNLLAEMFMYNEHLNCYKKPVLSDVSIYADIHFTYHVRFDDSFFMEKYREYQKRHNVSYSDFSLKYAEAIKGLRGREIYNIGSVGQPFDGTSASYVLLEGDLHSKEVSPYKLTFIRVPYDNEKAANFARNSSMEDKDAYIKEILTGIYRGMMT